MKKLFLFSLGLLLTACSSNPVSYLPSGNTPIVNVEAAISEKIKIDAQSEKLEVSNLTDQALNVVYKLFWYDIDGISQPELQTWQNLWLEAKQIRQIPLVKPSEEIANYRIYIRSSR